MCNWDRQLHRKLLTQTDGIDEQANALHASPSSQAVTSIETFTDYYGSMSGDGIDNMDLIGIGSQFDDAWFATDNETAIDESDFQQYGTKDPVPKPIIPPPSP